MKKVIINKQIGYGSFIDRVENGFGNSVIERLRKQNIAINEDAEEAILNTTFTNCGYYYEDGSSDGEEIICSVTIDSEISDYWDEYHDFYTAVLNELRERFNTDEIYYEYDSENYICF